MKIFPRFFYNDGSDGSGNAATGASTDGNNNNTSQQQGSGQIELPADIKAELDRLRAFESTYKKDDTPEKTPEEIAKAEQVDKANFIKYSVDTDLLKVEDIAAHDSIIAKADRDLVYDTWLKNWKEENPEVDAADVAELSKKDFEEEFKLTSTNEKAKARGESRLKKEADEIRSPLVNNYKTAKESYGHYQTVKENYPKFEKAVDSIIQETVPDELVYKTKEGEADIVIEGVKLTKEDKAEIAKLFKTDKNLVTFMQKNTDQAALKEAISKKIQGYLTTKYDHQIKDAIYKEAKGIGMKQGSNTGATNSFAHTQNNGGQQGATIIPINTDRINAANEAARQGLR